MSEYKIETKCVQGGYTPGNGEPRQIPIIQSTTFKYATSEDMGKLFDLEASGYFYTRLQNPTNDSVAAKICDMEGGTAAMLTSSGQPLRRSKPVNSPSSKPMPRQMNCLNVSVCTTNVQLTRRNFPGGRNSALPLSALWR